MSMRRFTVSAAAVSAAGFSAFSLAAVLLAAALATAAAAEDGETLMRRFLDKTPGGKISFLQKSVGRQGETVAESNGRFWFRRPNLFRMEYDPPDALTAVSDGENNWTYQPDLNQVIVRPAQTGGGTSAFLDVLATGDLSPLENDYILFSGDGGGLQWFTAEARTEDRQIRRMRMGFAEDGELRQVELNDSFGGGAVLEVISLSRAEANDSLFRFTPPIGADIIRE